MQLEDVIVLDTAKPRTRVVPWLLLLAVIIAGGAFYGAVYQPTLRELDRQELKLAAATQESEAARHQADASRATQLALEQAQSELSKLRSDLALTSVSRQADAKLLEQLQAQAAKGGVQVQGAGAQITVTLVDKILFKSGVADLTPRGQEMLRRLGGVFKSTDKLVEVSGHADNQPIDRAHRRRYPTNWELSTARATNVVRFLEEQVGIASGRLKAAGFGASRPVASNKRSAGRARNRRIEILLLPDNLKVVKGDFTGELAAARPSHP